MYLLNHCHHPSAHNQLKKITETNGDNGVNTSSKSGGSAVKPGQCSHQGEWARGRGCSVISYTDVFLGEGTCIHFREVGGG